MIVSSAVNPHSLRQRIIALAVGQSLAVSVDEHADTSVRHYASNLGFLMGRKYLTRIARESREIIVTREV